MLLDVAARQVPQYVTKVTRSLLPIQAETMSLLIRCQICRHFSNTLLRINDSTRFYSRSFTWNTQSYLFTWSRKVLWKSVSRKGQISTEVLEPKRLLSAESKRGKLVSSASKLRKKMKDTMNWKRSKITRKKLLPSNFSYKKLKDAYSDKQILDSGIDLSKLTLYQRMKFLLSHYGKVFIPLHYVVLSLFWFTSAYSAVYMGFDLMPYLEQLPEEIKDKLHLEKFHQHKQAGMLIQVSSHPRILQSSTSWLGFVTARVN